MRILLLSFWIVVSSLSLWAQGFKGGVTGGLVVSQVDGDKYSGYHKIGFQGGFYTRYYFNDKFSLTTMLRYVPKGSHFGDDKKQTYFKISLNYIDIPISVSYKLLDKLDVSAGISVGILFKPKVEDSVGTISSDRLPYKKTDFNVLAGVAYHITEKVSVKIEHAYSVVPINTRMTPQYNNLLVASLAYQF